MRSSRLRPVLRPVLRTVAALLVALPLVACATHRGIAGAAAGPDPEARPSAAGVVPNALRIDNTSRDRIDVYVVGQTRDWHVGRVDPGTTAFLSLPIRAVGPGMMSLAVIANAPRSMTPSRDARAVLTLGQPLESLMAQRWTFAPGRLTGLPRVTR
jgi:hypothetical protein